ncbi:hypothetical protein KC19_2G223200 [Ceratodon purpureus]|uniref:Uncharacterized protein n=1 Tax=Ceratodon purpureus TaxID=3225 RepID=A0A8T0IZK8_CERPU|nr:hypothetical protein KC19_2G223200 [Ceratodon purpureus]
MRIRCEETAKKSDDTSSGMSPWVPLDELSDSVNIGEDELHGFLSADEDSSNFDVDMTHLEMNAPEIQVFITTQQAPVSSSPGIRRNSKNSKVTSGFVSREDRPGRLGKKDGWRKQAAVLKAKYEVLKMEKEQSKRRWEEGCVEMAEAAQMAYSLRVAVESILEPDRRRVSLSAPCTPRGGKPKEENIYGLDERLRRLKASSAMRSKEMNIGAHVDLESQADALHRRIEMLQQKSQFPCSSISTPDESDSEIHQSDQQSIGQEDTDGSCYSPLSTRANDAVYRLLKQAEDGCILEEELAKQLQTKETVREILAQINAEAEHWKHVQGVLKNVSVEMATVQQACLRWEKRALDAETLAATRQREGEEWRVKSQTAQQKIEKLEVELTQLQETIEGVKQRHALEQSRWLDIGSGHTAANNLGYTVILQPIANTSSADSCRCSVVKDHSEGCKRSAELCTTSRQNLQGGRVLEPSNPDRNVSVPSRLPSPRRPTSREVSESTKVRQKPQNIGALAGTPTTEVNKVSSGSKTAVQRNGRERSLSVDRLSPRAPVRKASPTRSNSIFTENQENLSVSMNGYSASKKVFGTRGQSPAKKPGPSPAPGCRGPSPPRSTSSVHQRGPLKDVKTNIPLRYSDAQKV